MFRRPGFSSGIDARIGGIRASGKTVVGGQFNKKNMNEVLRDLAEDTSGRTFTNQSITIDGIRLDIVWDSSVGPPGSGGRYVLKNDNLFKGQTASVPNLIPQFDLKPKIIKGTPDLRQADINRRVNEFDTVLKENDVPDAERKIFVDELRKQLENNPSIEADIRNATAFDVAQNAQLVELVEPQQVQVRRAQRIIENEAKLEAIEVEVLEAKVDVELLEEIVLEVETVLDNAEVKVDIIDDLNKSIQIFGPFTASNVTTGKLINEAVNVSTVTRESTTSVIEAPSNEVKVAMQESAKGLEANAFQSHSKGLLSNKLLQTIRDIFPRVNKKWLLAGTIGLGLASGLAYLAYTLSLEKAGAQHQEDLNGCYLYDSITNTKKKINLLTCGDFATGQMIQTCVTQSYSPTATPQPVITECGKDVFNPCAKTAISRSSDPAVPMVPNVCSLYLYKGSAPAPITGVTTQDACKTEDGKAIPVGQACSGYCKTENFNLPENLTLMCIQVDYNTAFIDLMMRLGYDPIKLFPPAPGQPPAVSTISRPLAITTGVLGLAFVILLVVYMTRKPKV
jgi:hypothetical protein